MSAGMRDLSGSPAIGGRGIIAWCDEAGAAWFPGFEDEPGPRHKTDLDAIRDVWVDDVYRIGSLPDLYIRIIDVGAHIGAFTTRCLLACPKASVIAVEPSGDNLARLDSTLRHNRIAERQVKVIKGAVGTQSLRIDDNGMALPDPEGESYPEVQLAEIWPHTTRKDGTRCHIPVDILKLDVEGAEAEALLATDPLILSQAARIVIETHAGMSAQLGDLITHLLKTHHVEAFGVPNVGGMIYAQAY